MAANLSKKFALLCSCLMTMQALRLVISTAGFCAVRFHIDCELFNIFISRFVNASLIAQLIGNWLGDLIVFATDGKRKIIGLMIANWAEFICFCSALYCIVHTECGHLTGFYWSMAAAAFWWKVGEAPTMSIAAPNATDYYFAGFTLSGVWAACLKGLVMTCINNPTVADDAVTLVGARSVKTTVDYRAAKWLYIITIIITFLMCSAWTVPVAVQEKKEQVATELAAILEGNKEGVKKAMEEAGVRNVDRVRWVRRDGTEYATITVRTVDTAVRFAEPENRKPEQATWLKTEMEKTKEMRRCGEMTYEQGTERDQGLMKTVGAFKEWWTAGSLDREKFENALGQMGMLVGGMIKPGKDAVSGVEKIGIKVNPAWVLENDWLKASEYLSGIAFGGVLAVPGAMLGAGLVWVCGVYITAFQLADNSTCLRMLTALAMGIIGMCLLIAVGVALGKAENQLIEWMTRIAGDVDTRLDNRVETLTKSTNTILGKAKNEMQQVIKVLVTNTSNALGDAKRDTQSALCSLRNATIKAVHCLECKTNSALKNAHCDSLNALNSLRTNTTTALHELGKKVAGLVCGLMGEAWIDELLVHGVTFNQITEDMGGTIVDECVAKSWVKCTEEDNVNSELGGNGFKARASWRWGHSWRKTECKATGLELKVAESGTTLSCDKWRLRPGSSWWLTPWRGFNNDKWQLKENVTLKDNWQVTSCWAKQDVRRWDLLYKEGVLWLLGVAFIFGGVFVGVLCLTVGAVIGAKSLSELRQTSTKWCQLIFGIVGAAGGMAAGITPVMTDTKMVGDVKVEGMWVEALKTPWPTYKLWKKVLTVLAAMIGLIGGITLGALVGLCIGACKGSKKRGTAAGALVGGFVGLLTGEIANAAETWDASTSWVGGTPGEKATVLAFGIIIVVFGLGTVYSIYPGMAPCSIAQFKYFNIIDISILILSAIAPFLIMYADLSNAPWKLALTILANKDEKWAWVTVGILLLLVTNICEIIVIIVMQHPESKLAQKITSSPWRACTLTIVMVTSQLTSTGIGFACVAAGSGFNDGVINANSTLVMWTMQCTGIVGEGYLTELKKYEPGKWPTQGMGKWATYWWWRNKAFVNAWAIWCCIGTTDLRRDIMLCRQ